MKRTMTQEITADGRDQIREGIFLNILTLDKFLKL
jgi:hypothetical protein